MSISKGRRRNYNNHVVHSGNKEIKNYYDKYNLGERKRQSTGLKFNLVGTHLYKDVTEQEVALRETYAKSLISNYENASDRRVSIDMIDYNYTITRRTETFGVKIGKQGWGRIIITTNLLPGRKDLQFVLFKKSSTGVYKSHVKKKGNWK